MRPDGLFSIDVWNIILDVMEWVMEFSIETFPVHQSLGLSEELSSWLGEGPILIISLFGQLISLELFAVLLSAMLLMTLVRITYIGGRLIRRVMNFFGG